MKFKDYYAILGVSRSATADDLLRVARRYLVPERLTVAAVLPEASAPELDDKAVAQALDEGGGALGLVVLVEGQDATRGVDVEVLAEATQAAGVLRGDERNLAEDPEGTQGDVFQVSDGRCDDVQRGRHGRCRGGTQVLSH